jgi:hypothetical protein
MMEIGSMPSFGESGPVGGFWSVKSFHGLVVESLAIYSEMLCKMPISRSFIHGVFSYDFQCFRRHVLQMQKRMRRFGGVMALRRMDSEHAKRYVVIAGCQFCAPRRGSETTLIEGNHARL